MRPGPGRRSGAYSRLHWSLLDECDATDVPPALLGVYAYALLASARHGRDGIVTVRDVARGITMTAARRALVALEERGWMRQIDRATWEIVGYASDQMTEAAWATRREEAARRKRKSRAMAEARAEIDRRDAS